MSSWTKDSLDLPPMDKGLLRPLSLGQMSQHPNNLLSYLLTYLPVEDYSGLLGGWLDNSVLRLTQQNLVLI